MCVRVTDVDGRFARPDNVWDRIFERQYDWGYPKYPPLVRKIDQGIIRGDELQTVPETLWLIEISGPGPFLLKVQIVPACILRVF
jgi:hypothetical protein